MNVQISVSPFEETKEYFSLVALSPAPESDEKYEPSLINYALNNERYHAFYIEGNPEIRAYSSEPDDIETPHLAIIVGLDSKTKQLCKSKYEWHFSSRAKGILLLNDKFYKDAIETYVTYDSFYKIERIF